MPFGLSNAPASFQGYINKILAEKLDIFVVEYLDDILIYTEDPGQLHVGAVRWVLEQLRKHGLYANLKKCRFYENEVQFLSFVVSTQGIRIEKEDRGSKNLARASVNQRHLGVFGLCKLLQEIHPKFQ